MIVNHRVPARYLKAGDNFVAIHALPVEPARSYGVVAQVRRITRDGHDVIVEYTCTDDPSGMCYGSDVTLHRNSTVTLVTVTA